MHKPFSLAALNLALVILSLLIFALVLSLFLSFGLDAVQDSWHAKEEASLNSYIVTQLLEAPQPVSPETASSLFSSLPYAPTYLYVSDSLGQLLYFELSLFHYAQASTVIIAMLLLSIAVDQTSAWLRRRMA